MSWKLKHLSAGILSPELCSARAEARTLEGWGTLSPFPIDAPNDGSSGTFVSLQDTLCVALRSTSGYENTPKWMHTTLCIIEKITCSKWCLRFTNR